MQTLASRETSGVADLPSALRIKETLQQMAQDEQEEWEYEYSTTEHETYYLTLELSYPEFKERATKVPRHSRGGYYKNWLEQPVGKPTDDAIPQRPENEANDDDDEPVPAAEAEPDDDLDDDMANLDPALRDMSRGMNREAQQPEPTRDKGKGVDRGKPAPVAPAQPRNTDNGSEQEEEEEEEILEDIQILELHSDNPIISYRGRIFEGEWAEVLGTEIIVADRDTGVPLPALRNLNEGIDLLAASSSRILTKEKIAEPKVPEEDELAPIREEWNIRIPPGRDPTGEKKHQARFLENLIALKMKKGETDRVTVFAKEGEGKDFLDNRDPDYKPRRRRPNGEGEGNFAGVRQRGGRRPYRTRARGRPRGSAAAQKAAPHSVPNPLSTPTPGRWDDLSRDGPGEDEDGEDEGDGEDEEVESGGGSDREGPDAEMDDNQDEDEDEDEDITMVG